ncbi:MAG: OmpA family protein [Ignavibacteriales bacterium]|nr:OmpA family protein [Ignavibacteriales bacterium]
MLVPTRIYATENLLKAMGEQFGKLNNKVVIEGHTDAHPFQNGATGYTNYELSADRANSARRALQAGGLQEANIIEIRGFADKKLKNPGDPFDLVNRRISIVVKYPGAQ